MPLSKYDIDVDLERRQGTSHAFLVEMVGANKRVLDVGCDTGYLGEALAARGNHTLGFEVNDVTAAEARTRLEHVEVGDLESVDLVEVFGRGSFDIVVFGDVLEHLRDPLPVLRQARPLLAPGGSVLISTPNVAHGDIRLALLQGRFRYTNVGILDETHTRFFTRDSLVEFLQDAGFTLVELRRTRADLFSTEADVREADFDPAVVAALREDPEATTYQFVVRAVPDDAAAATSAQALRVDELQGQLAAAEAACERAAAEHEAERAAMQSRVDELTGQLAAERDERGREQAQIGVSAAERDELRAELAEARERAAEVAKRLEAELAAERSRRQALEETVTMRVARAPRAVYARLRSR